MCWPPWPKGLTPAQRRELVLRLRAEQAGFEVISCRRGSAVVRRNLRRLGLLRGFRLTAAGRRLAASL